MKLRLGRYILLILCVCVVSVEANAQVNPRAVLRGVITQLQTGNVNASWYGVQLWLTIAFATGFSGVYPQLVSLGPVVQITLNQQQKLPDGTLYRLTAEHENGKSIWLLGISSVTGKIEYADFGVDEGDVDIEQKLDIPSPSSDTQGAGSAACKKFPNLCQ